jgi:4-hydroxybenzoate polyprenyltransferase
MQEQQVPSALPQTLRSPWCLARFLASFWSEIRFCVKASRPGFWLTAMWFYLLPLGTHFPLDSPAFWLGLAYVGLPLGMLIYAGNDVTDELTDKLNPRKDTFLFGARPTKQQIAGLPLRIALIQLPFVITFVWLLGPRALLWFAALLAMTLLYNSPRFGAKDRPVFDVLAQIGYLLVFVLSNWLNGQVLSPWYLFAFGALFAMHSHMFGEVMDIAPDKAAGRKTTAVAIGPRASKALVVVLLLIEFFLASNIHYKPWLPYFLAAGVIFFALDAAFIWRERSYAAWQMTTFFLGWNAFLLLEIGTSVFRSLDSSA